jgi:pyruvate/2-oxoglutarate dehydrogenase complex dihydrolipoamide dehydrogenase (E3) component
MADCVLPTADHDVSVTLERSYRTHGVDVVTGTTASNASRATTTACASP